MQPPIRMYATATCPYCIRAEQLLLDKGVVGLDKIRVDLDPSRREEMMKLSGRRTVPQIFIGDYHVGGCDDLLALERLHDAPLREDGEALVEPEVLGVRVGDEVAGPAVRELVRHQFVVEAPHEAHGLVLHAAAPRELGVAVLLIGEGVLAEEVTVKLHLRDAVHGAALGVGEILWEYVVQHLHISAGERDHIAVHRIVRDREGDQVVIDRVAVPPMEADVAVAEIVLGDQ